MLRISECVSFAAAADKNVTTVIIFASDILHEALLSVTKVRKSYAADTPD